MLLASQPCGLAQRCHESVALARGLRLQETGVDFAGELGEGGGFESGGVAGVLRYKVVASLDRPGGTIDVRSFENPDKAVAWINANVCVLPPEDRTTLFGEGYLKLPRAGFLIVVTYRKPWWAPRAWVEDEWHVIVGAVLVAIGVLSIFRSRGPLSDWFPALWILSGVLLLGRGRRRL